MLSLFLSLFTHTSSFYNPSIYFLWYLFSATIIFIFWLISGLNNPNNYIASSTVFIWQIASINLLLNSSIFISSCGQTIEGSDSEIKY